MGLEEFDEQRQSERPDYVKEFPTTVYFIGGGDSFVVRKTHFVPGVGIRICAEESCPLCAKGEAPRKTFWVEVYDLVEKQHKILSRGPALGRILKKYDETLKNDSNDPDGIKGKVLKIEKVSRDTFSIVPLEFKGKPKPIPSKLNVEEYVSGIKTTADDEITNLELGDDIEGLVPDVEL